MDEMKEKYMSFESLLARFERMNRRLWVLCIILIIALIGSNAGWLYYENQYQDITTTIEAEQDGDGVNIVGGGDVNYGSESQDDNN